MLYAQYAIVRAELNFNTALDSNHAIVHVWTPNHGYPI